MSSQGVGLYVNFTSSLVFFVSSKLYIMNEKKTRRTLSDQDISPPAVYAPIFSHSGKLLLNVHYVLDAKVIYIVKAWSLLQRVAVVGECGGRIPTQCE